MELTLKIDGMSCEHCVKRITSALNILAGTNEVSINLEQKTALISFVEERCDKNKIIQVIEELGYEVIE